METLRRYPIVPRTVRTVSNAFEFAGCTVPAGRQVILDFTLTHHLPEYFPDPQRFDIERFAPPRNEHRQSGVYVPYAWGRTAASGSTWPNSWRRPPWRRSCTTWIWRWSRPATP